jgi:WXG100 family type VII secretion target
MQIRPDDMQTASGDIRQLSGDAQQVLRLLQRSWQRLDYGWQSYARRDVDGAYTRAMQELVRAARMLEQLSSALHMTSVMIRAADQEVVGLFSTELLRSPLIDAVVDAVKRGVLGGILQGGKDINILTVEDGLPTQVGSYTLGPPKRPNIQHDNGFLDVESTREPTIDDLKSFAKWLAALKAMKAELRLGKNDLDDGLAAYESFLLGDGSDQYFSYSEYVKEDPSGAATLETVMLDAQTSAEEFFADAPDGQISITSEAFAAGGADPRFPYPETENWQKAIGAHPFWVNADIQSETGVSGQKNYTMTLTVHAEDRYNFNPGMADITTGTSDDVNGQFELCGLGKQFMHYGEATYTVSWDEGEALDLSGIVPTEFPEENPSEFMSWAKDHESRD